MNTVTVQTPIHVFVAAKLRKKNEIAMFLLIHFSYKVASIVCLHHYEVGHYIIAYVKSLACKVQMIIRYSQCASVEAVLSVL